MKINTEISLKDIINIFLIVFGGLLTYALVDRVSVENDTVRTKQALLTELPSLYPNVKIHYTNQLTENKEHLEIKVFFLNKGKYPLFVSYPNLYLMSNSDTLQNYDASPLSTFGGQISPNQEFEVMYSFGLSDIESIPNAIGMTYPTNIESRIMEAYSGLFNDVIDQINDSTMYWITHKSFNYQQKVFAHGENDIWSDFFANPR